MVNLLNKFNKGLLLILIILNSCLSNTVDAKADPLRLVTALNKMGNNIEVDFRESEEALYDKKASPEANKKIYDAALEGIAEALATNQTLRKLRAYYEVSGRPLNFRPIIDALKIKKNLTNLFMGIFVLVQRQHDLVHPFDHFGIMHHI